MSGMIAKVGLIISMLICIPMSAEADFVTMDEYIETSPNLAAFDETVVAEMDAPYEIIDGVLFRDHTLIRYPAQKEMDTYVVPEGTIAIDRNAFVGVEVGTITTICLPASCIELGEVSEDGWWLEYLGGVENIIVDRENPRFSSQAGLLLTKEGDTLLFYPRGRVEKVFCIPEQIEVVANAACMGCKFEQVMFPTNLKEIGECAFYQNNLKSLDFNEGLVYIGASAFEGSNHIRRISVPGNVKEIDDSAFAQCASLCDVNLEEGIREVADYAFFASPVSDLYLPKSLVHIGEGIIDYQDDDGREGKCMYSTYADSYALEWVKKHDLEYRILDEPSAMR